MSTRIIPFPFADHQPHETAFRCFDCKIAFRPTRDETSYCPTCAGWHRAGAALFAARDSIAGAVLSGRPPRSGRRR